MPLPAYNGYQSRAKQNTVEAALNNGIKAFNACIALEDIATCGANNVNNTLTQQPGTTLTVTKNAGNTAACIGFKASKAESDQKHEGCVEFDNVGKVTKTIYDDGGTYNSGTAPNSRAGTCAIGACS